MRWMAVILMILFAVGCASPDSCEVTLNHLTDPDGNPLKATPLDVYQACNAEFVQVYSQLVTQQRLIVSLQKRVDELEKLRGMNNLVLETSDGR